MGSKRDSAGKLLCPQCDSPLERTAGFGAKVAALLVLDAVTWILALGFVGLGLLWTPAYLIATCLAGLGLYMALKKPKSHLCRKCGREYAPGEVASF